MAKQVGIIPLSGAIDNVTFSNTRDGYKAGKKSNLNGKKIATNPAFLLTRQNNAEFGRAGKAALLLRNATRSLTMKMPESRLFTRLNTEMMKVIKADTTNPRGLRNVIDGEAELLKDFEFNANGKLLRAITAPFTAAIDRVAGTLTVNVPSFNPELFIIAPASATHFKLNALGAAIDFESETFQSDVQQSALLSLKDSATAAIMLTSTVPAGSTHPLFLAYGVQFFQVVSGIPVLLTSAAASALKLVAVEGI